jgi:RNA polymerase sigma-70 factor, ECF subfamily
MALTPPVGSQSRRGRHRKPTYCPASTIPARLLTVSTTIRTDGQRSDAAPATLGDVLYAKTAGVRVSESDWVRLVRSIAAGDQFALRDLYERTHRLVYTLTLRMTHSRETAEELTLDVFHDVWRKAGSYDPPGGTVLGWIMNQARSRALDHLRYVQRKKRVDPHSHESFAVTMESPPDEATDLRVQARLLQQALTALSSDERQAIEAAFFNELSYSEAAAQLDQPLGTVKTRIRSSLVKLRRALNLRTGER